MRRDEPLLLLAIVILLVATLCPAGCEAGKTDHAPVSVPPSASPASAVREEAPVHASPISGSFYPGNPQVLRKTILGFLDRVPSAVTRDAADLAALIVPHAGYEYSGATAAYGYKILGQRKPKRVVLLGPSHYASFRGISMGDYSAFETPLGRVPVDPAAKERLRNCPLVSFHPSAHLQEHSLDVQIPFLQVLFDPSPPLIVPLLVGELGEEDYSALADCLSGLLDEDTVLVASSDFTHYGPRFQYMPFPNDQYVEKHIEAMDDGAWEKIRQGDRSGFLAYREKTGITVCGFQPIGLLLQILPKGIRAEKVHYETSAKQTGDHENSVSYMTIAFYRPDRAGPPTTEEVARTGGNDKMDKTHGADPAPRRGTKGLSPSERGTLIRIARDTLEQYVRGRKTPDPKAGAYEITPAMKEDRGAFVTLKIHGELRGCVGHIFPIEPLYETVQDNTVNAAARDTRFTPVRPDELDVIDMEISVLSKPVPVPSYRDIEIGKHGILLEKGLRKAVFLPQVAPEQGWGLEETLRHLSMKAGLDSRAWQDPETRFSVFTAEIIEEDR